MSQIDTDVWQAREDLEWLRSRYDCGPVTDALYRVIKGIETDLSWAEHRAAQRAATRELQRVWSIKP